MHVIICGFTYGNFGTVKVDLIRMIHWANKRNWKVTLITDDLRIDPPELWIGYRDGLLPSYYESLGLPPIKRVITPEDLQRFFNGLSPAKRVLFYYSGHADINDLPEPRTEANPKISPSNNNSTSVCQRIIPSPGQGIRMPNGHIFGYDVLQANLIKLTKIELFGLFDCCHSPDFGLHWQLTVNGSIRRDKISPRSKDIRITLLTATDPDEEAAGSHYGSFLTRVFVEQVDTITELPTLLKTFQTWVTEHHNAGTQPKGPRKRTTQTINLYSNHCRKHFLPIFLFGLIGPTYVDC